jgi:hypothetical protein
VNVGPAPGPAPDPHQIDMNQIEQARRQINRLAEEIAQLSEMELSPPEYYGEFLQRLMAAIAAPAGAVWVKTPQGNLQIQYQINMRQVGLDRAENTRAQHDELLRQVTGKAQPGIIMPHSSTGEPTDGKAPPGNPTDYVILVAPIMYDKQLAGLVEIWQDPNRGTDAQRGFLQFIVRMAGLAAAYTRNHQLRQMVSQEQVWLQLEAFAQKIHATLNPTEVAYLVANEGRRLVEADRVSVAVREGKKPQVKAISGADVVEKRSNLVQLMRTLFEKVIDWGDKLVYTGTKDEGLPPGVLQALDAYLAESNSKLLVVLPLKDERETEGKQKARSAVMMESFESNATADLAVSKLEVVGRHAGSALYNAAEYRRIPMRFLWLPLAKIQDGLGGKAKAIVTLIMVGLGALIAAMIFIPYPLKMDAGGQLLPKDRQQVYPPVTGQIVAVPPSLKSGTQVVKDQELFRMYDKDLAQEIWKLMGEINAATETIKAIKPGKDEGDQSGNKDLLEAKANLMIKSQMLENLKRRVNAHSNPGEFGVKSPMTGIVLSSDFRESLLNRYVKPNEALLRVGYTDVKNPKVSDWEIELKIPQKHIGQVLEAYKIKEPGAELDVDILLTRNPTRIYKGKLLKSKIASEAKPQRDANNEPEPVVLAWVRISPKDIPAGKDASGKTKFVKDIPDDSVIPPELLLTGVEVRSRIRCGTRAMGYSLFYGVWEFIYEKIVFFF